MESLETMSRVTVRELGRLVRTHGGILGAIEYGVRSESIEDPEIASAWRRVEEQYFHLRPNLSVLSRVLRAASRG